jgi:hypothetical protein
MRMRSRGTANILSVMICERTRSPFSAFASTVGLIGSCSVRRDVMGQTSSVVVRPPNSSVWTTTTGRGRPSSPWTTTTTLPRFTSIRSSHTTRRSKHRSRRFQDGERVAFPGGEGRLAPADRARREPSVGSDASLVHATACAARSFAPWHSLAWSWVVARTSWNFVTCYEFWRKPLRNARSPECRVITHRPSARR